MIGLCKNAGVLRGRGDGNGAVMVMVEMTCDVFCARTIHLTLLNIA